MLTVKQLYLYRCNICESEYEQPELARACEMRGVRPSSCCLGLGDVVYIPSDNEVRDLLVREEVTGVRWSQNEQELVKQSIVPISGYPDFCREIKTLVYPHVAIVTVKTYIECCLGHDKCLSRVQEFLETDIVQDKLLEWRPLCKQPHQTDCNAYIRHKNSSSITPVQLSTYLQHVKPMLDTEGIEYAIKHKL